MKGTLQKIVYLLVIVTFCSCSENEDLVNSQETNNTQKEKFFVTKEEASEIALNIFSRTKALTRSTDIEITPMGKTKDSTFCYISNLRRESFVIISADKRTFPILAYSDNNYFDINPENYPSALCEWLYRKNKYIDSIRNTPGILEYSSEEWNIENMVGFIKNNRELNTRASEGPKTIFSIGPLLKTNWGQADGYNNSCPYKECSTTLNEKTYTGCVATAMAQIMAFHKYPEKYRWEIMPNYVSDPNSEGANEISKLMWDAGCSVTMSWGCDGSSAKSYRIPKGFKSSLFNYKSAELSNTDITSKIESEIKAGYPVILTGGHKKTTWLIIHKYRGGHAWVCDGVMKKSMEVRIPIPRHGHKTITRDFNLYHMNWGWHSYFSNSTYNGWYQDFRVDGDDFTYKNNIIYNIRK